MSDLTPETGSTSGLDKAEKDARTWGMLCHLSALAGLVAASLGSWVGPLVIWLVKRNDHPFIDAQGKESLNFQISMFIYAVVSLILCLVFIGFVLLGIICLLDLILPIIAAVQASDGKSYRYPITIRFLK
ncbi:MAG TPA: DUF4870 domain-containing protein [Planctomycetota bacterium]|jgi:hypothetical protein